MSRSEEYRRQSRETRVAARAHLRQLREERLARRGPGKEQRPATAEGAAAQAPQFAVSRAASEAISEWSRQDPSGAAPAAEDADGSAPQPTGPAGDTPADAATEAALGGNEPADAPEAAPAECPAQEGRLAEVAGTRVGPDMAHAAPSSSGSDAVPPVDPPPPGAATRERKTAAATTDLAAGDASDGNMAPREVTPPGEAADAEPQAERCATTEAGDTAPPAVAGGTEASPAVDESDLHALPGAGIGLVWMLQRCGVSSLADLADADPERLRRDMGLVGELLDLSTWIAFARDAVEDKPPTRP